MMAVKEPVKFPFNRSKIHPLMFMLWASIGSLIMMFAAMTSFILVREAAGNWFQYEIPSQFYTSTVLIVLSSITLHISYKSFKNGNVKLYRWLLPVTFILGISFVIFQYYGWLALNDAGLYLADDKASVDIFIVVTGLHALHVLGGIGALILANIHAFSLPYKLTETRKQRFARTLTYWHFVDILWIYLLIVFLIVLT